MDARGRPMRSSKPSSSSAGVDSNIKVVIRVRPNRPPAEDSSTSCIKTQGSFIEAKATADVTQPGKKFTFDAVIPASGTQEQLYSLVGGKTVETVLSGFNGTILAYGQTGSGKTHTMIGPDGGDLRGLDESSPMFHDRGLIPRLCAELFTRLQSKLQSSLSQAEQEALGGGDHFSSLASWEAQCSMYEVYEEKVRDLLVSHTATRDHHPPPQALRVVGDKRNIRVVDLTSTAVSTVAELLRVLRSGMENRVIRATNSNKYSSRSHAIMQMILSQKFRDGRETVSKLNLVDLAGSERLDKTGAEGVAAKEGCQINVSLSALGKVIHDLCHGYDHIPYRSSQLTRVLQDSLGGNSVTTMICTVSGHSSNAEETVSTLGFANNAKQIRNHAVQNVILSSAELQARLDLALEENDRLKRELNSKNARLKQDLAVSVMAGAGAAGVDMGVSALRLAPLISSCAIGTSVSAMGVGGGGGASMSVNRMRVELEQEVREVQEQLKDELRAEKEKVAEANIEVVRLTEEVKQWKESYSESQASQRSLEEKFRQSNENILAMNKTIETLRATAAAVSSGSLVKSKEQSELSRKEERERFSSLFQGVKAEVERLQQALVEQSKAIVSLRSEHTKAMNEMLAEKYAETKEKDAAVERAEDLMTEKMKMTLEAIALKDELRELEAKTEEIVAQKISQAQKSSYVDWEKERKDLQSTSKALKKRLEELESSSSTLKSRLEKVKVEKEKALEDKDRVLEELRVENRALTQKVEESQRVEETLQETIQQSGVRIRENEFELADLHRKLDQVPPLEKILQDQAARAQVEQNISHLNSQLTSLQSSNATLNQKVKELEAKVKELKEKLKRRVENERNLRGQVDQLQDKLDTEVNMRQAQKQGFEVAIADRDTEITKLKAVIEEMVKQIELSRLSNNEKLKIIQGANDILHKKISYLEELARKLYDETAQAEFVQIVEEDLQLREEEVQHLTHLDSNLLDCLNSLSGKKKQLHSDVDALTLTSRSATDWKNMEDHLGLVKRLLERTPFIHPSDESRRLACLAKVEELTGKIQTSSEALEQCLQRVGSSLKDMRATTEQRGKAKVGNVSTSAEYEDDFDKEDE